MPQKELSFNQKFSSYQILVIVLLALTQFTVVLDFMVMSPLGDILMKSMNMTTTQFGLVVSAYAFSAGIAGILTAGFAAADAVKQDEASCFVVFDVITNVFLMFF